MSARERAFIFSAIAVALVAVLYTFMLDAEMNKQKRLSSTLAQRQAEIKSLEAQIGTLATSRGTDAERAQRQRLAAVREQLADLERQIGAEERKFTTPAQMKRVIDEMLARNRSVQ